MYALLSARSSTGYDAKSERPSVERAESIFHITSKGDEGIVRRVPRHERVGRAAEVRGNSQQACKSGLKQNVFDWMNVVLHDTQNEADGD